jgi:hypothetical protein
MVNRPGDRYGYLKSAGKAALGIAGAALGKAAVRTAVNAAVRKASSRRGIPYKSKKKNRSFAKRPQKLTKRVRALEHKVKEDDSVLTYRTRAATRQVLSAVNTQSHAVYSINTVSVIETALAGLLYYDPAVPGTLVTAAFATGTYSRRCLIKSIYSKLLVRNNYQVPCKVTIYQISVRTDSNTDAVTAFTAGLTDNASGALSDTSLQVYLSDSSQFNQLYKIDKTKSLMLMPGKECTSIITVPQFYYDPSEFDSIANQYQKIWKYKAFVVRLEGVLGHDTVSNSQICPLLAGVDLMKDTVIKVVYDSGTSLKFCTLSDSTSAISTLGVTSEQPIADNISYSVT